MTLRHSLNVLMSMLFSIALSYLSFQLLIYTPDIGVVFLQQSKSLRDITTLANLLGGMTVATAANASIFEMELASIHSTTYHNYMTCIIDGHPLIELFPAMSRTH
jgi:hypothetical protein